MAHDCQTQVAKLLLLLILCCEDENNQHVMSVGQRKNLSPQQDLNLIWSPKHRAGTLSTELWRTHGERGHILGSYWHVSCVLLLYCCYTAYWYCVVAKLKFKPGKFFLLAMVTKIITLWNAAYYYVVSCTAYLRTWDQNLEQEDNCDVLPYYGLLHG